MQSVKIDRYLRAAIVVLSVALVYVISVSIHQRVVEAGDSAPGFAVRAENGQTVALPNFGGKVLVLNFWASWCPPCVQETPSLSKLASDYKDKGVVVLALSVDKDEKAYRDFLKRFQPTFLTARDFQVHEDYGTFIYPETYIIDAKGKVRKKIAEGADWNNPELTGFIDSLL
jgi:cytochrome c biogenesis protein CcmG, thiol:disulfide interchange protein DsbE